MVVEEEKVSQGSLSGEESQWVKRKNSSEERANVCYSVLLLDIKL